MDWLDVAKVAAPLAPTLGGILGGLIPIPGASIAGQALGSIIARQFGVPATPDAVHGALTTNPNEVVLAKLNAAMEEARAQWPALAEMEKAWAATTSAVSESVNQTMRIELEHQSPFFTGWRPCAGWLFNFFALTFGLMLAQAVWLAGRHGSPAMLAAMKDAQTMAGALLGALAAVVGVYIIGRSKEKSTAIEAVGASPVPAAPDLKPRKSGK